MAWRDRTNLFISYRQSTPHHPAKRARFSGPHPAYADEERQGLMSAGAFDDRDSILGGSSSRNGDAVIEMDTLPPRWLDIQDQVAELLADIAGRTKRLEGLHSKHVLPGFDDEAVKAKEEQEIEALTRDITRSFQQCQRAIARVDGLLKEEQVRGQLGDGEEKMARNLKIALATRVQEASTQFRKKQSAYLRKLRSMNGLPSSPQAAGFTTSIQNPYADPSLLDSEADRSFSQSTIQQSREQQQAQKRKPNANEALISSREREIEAIAQGVIELASIFQDLNSMVIDQGSLLDRIDYNVENTLTQVKEADKELKVATNYQRRSMKRKILLLLIIIVAGMFILLGLKLGRRKSPDANGVIGQPNGEGANTNGAPFNSLEERTWRRRRKRLWDGGSDRLSVVWT